MFQPPQTGAFNGVLTLRTASGKQKCILRGIGRKIDMELYPSAGLEFLQCLRGNVYEKFVTIKNTSDVGFDVEIFTSREEERAHHLSEKEDTQNEPEKVEALSIFPSKAHVPPFDEIRCRVDFSPTEDMDLECWLHFCSTYTTTKMPARLHAGSSTLLIEPTVINFGHFHIGEFQVQQMRIKN